MRACCLLGFKSLLSPLLLRSAKLHHLIALLHLLARGLPGKIGLQARLEGLRNAGPRRADPAEDVLVWACDHERHDRSLSLCDIAEQIAHATGEIAHVCVAALLQGVERR